MRQARVVAEALRTEAIGGGIMLGAALVALVWANTPVSGAYEAMRHAVVGPLSLEEWASDGLLTVFFLVAGIELRREFVSGELRSPRKAALPIIAAVTGMVLPAAVFVGVSWGADRALDGWAVPMATDIALALAVLAVSGAALPAALRAFLLTLAVVDDLGSITVIAIFYTHHISYVWLAVTVVLLAAFALLQWRGVHAPWAYVPLGIGIWAAMHASGVHATVAGVAMGLLVGSERAEHLLRPVSAGLAVPVFALMSAGVSLRPDALAAVFTDRVALGVIAGLVVGKAVGVLGGARLAVWLRLARVSDDLHWRDIAAVSVLAGVGFTVSLLVGDLAYGTSAQVTRVTTAVLVATVVSGALAAVLLRIRVRRRRMSMDTASEQ